MKPFNIKDFEILLNQLKGLTIQPIEDDPKAMGVVNIRHDVDDDFPASGRMGNVEFANGIRSTYFILDTATYFSDALIILTGISDLAKNCNHSIGWHNNALANLFYSGKGIKECIEEPLAKLRKITRIIGTASHGDPLCYQKGYLNSYIWQDVKKHPKFPNYKFPKFKLSDFGLEYEAYFTGHTHYISDSGGEWHQDNGQVIEDYRRKLSEGEKVKLQILIHPQWWSL